MNTKNTETTLALYEDFTPEANEDDIEEVKKLYPGKMLGKIQVGKTVLRMLPPRPGHKTPWRRVWEHYLELPGLPNGVSFVCPRAEAQLQCRVCTKAKVMMASTNPVDRERGEEMLPKANMYANVIDRMHPENGVKIWKFTGGILKNLQTLRAPNGVGVNFTHPVHGQDLFIIRAGLTKNDTKYTVNVNPAGPTPLSDDATSMTDILKQMHDLDALAVVLSDADIQRKLAGEKVSAGSAKPAGAAPVTAPKRDMRPTAAQAVFASADAAALAPDDDDDVIVPMEGDDDI